VYDRPLIRYHRDSRGSDTVYVHSTVYLATQILYGQTLQKINIIT
jgi:hypothetical protein